MNINMHSEAELRAIKLAKLKELHSSSVKSVPRFNVFKQ